MFELELFLGFPIDEAYKQMLAKADPSVVSLFIQPGQNYLQKIIYEDIHYLGKFAGKINESSNLDLLAENIYSLLKKITPDYPCQNVPLILFPASLE